MIRFVFTLITVAGFVFGNVSGQPSSLAIVEAHGGGTVCRRDLRVEVRGTLETPKGKADFILKISGQRSRLEIPGHIYLRNGMLGQEILNGNRRSEARWIRHGFQETLLLPFIPIARLSDYRYENRSDGMYWFSTRVPIKRFLGYNPPLPIILLGFDEKTLRLQAA